MLTASCHECRHSAEAEVDDYAVRSHSYCYKTPTLRSVNEICVRCSRLHMPCEKTGHGACNGCRKSKLRCSLTLQEALLPTTSNAGAEPEDPLPYSTALSNDRSKINSLITAIDLHIAELLHRAAEIRRTQALTHEPRGVYTSLLHMY